MSLASHAVNRLKKLWKKTYLYNRLLDSIKYAYPSSQHFRCTQSLFEQLEPRVLLSGTIYSVNTLADVVADDGMISLREAIEAANTNNPVNEAPSGCYGEMDIIYFDLQGTISLYGSELTITDNLRIEGQGADSLTIDANGSSRVFSVNSNVTAELFGLTIAGGNSYNGGGIYNAGMLDIEYLIITGNTANQYGDGGGGICNSSSGTLTVTNSIISCNSANRGGGIYNYRGTLTIINSVISGNLASGEGGGISSFDGVLTVTNSTITGNSANISGGGMKSSDTFTVNNSIIALNNGGNIEGSVISNNSVIAIDPMFVRNPSAGLDNIWGTDDDDLGDLHLTQYSPAVNAGNNALAVDSQGIPLVTDMDGTTRIINNAVDAGAYESYWCDICNGEIHGMKWNDLDGDGIQDANEPGLEGWTIYLDQNDNDILDTGEQSTVTDQYGNYSFTGITLGTYKVAEIPQDRWMQSYPESGSQDIFFLHQSCGQGILDDHNGHSGLTGQLTTVGDIVNDHLLADSRPTYIAELFADTNEDGQYGDGLSSDALNADILMFKSCFYVLWDLQNPDKLSEWQNSFINEVASYANQHPGQTLVVLPAVTLKQESGLNDQAVELARDWADWLGEEFITDYCTAGNVVCYDLFDFWADSENDLSNANYLREEYIRTGDDHPNDDAYSAAADDIFIFLQENIDSSYNSHTVTLTVSNAIQNDINFGSQEILPGEIRGTMWNDIDGDGIRNEGEPGLAGWPVFLDQNNNGILDDLWTSLEPDDYASETVLDTVIPGVTLYATNTSAGHVFSRIVPCDASTGEKVFCHNPGNNWNMTQRLKMIFDQPVTSVSIDFINWTAGGSGRIDVYDANNNLLDSYITDAMAGGQIQTMTINRPAGDIAYALASGNDGYTGSLDNLVFKNSENMEVSVITDIDGNYAFTDLPVGAYTVVEVIPTGWSQTYPGSVSDDFYAIELTNGQIATGVNFGNQQNPVWVVDTLDDIVALDGKLSLREAIEAANTNMAVNEAAAGSHYAQDTILFDASLTGGTIVLSSQLTVSGKMAIQGLGAEYLTLDADGYERVFEIESSAEVLIEGLTITGGFFDDPTVSPYTSGGGIFNAGVLTVKNAMISGNIASSGGGIFNYNGTLNVVDSTLDHNESIRGGGIYNYLGSINIWNSTIVRNTADSGGGIINNGTLILTNSTVASNSANTGGGIYNSPTSGNLVLNNTVVAMNHSDLSPFDDIYGPYEDERSFVGDEDGDPLFVRNPSAGSDGIWGTADDYIGDLHLRPDSPLVNAGLSSLAVDSSNNPLTTDIAGSTRIVDESVDIGAYEYQTVFGVAYVVNSLEDVVSSDGVVTLREAIMAANGEYATSDVEPGSDTQPDLIVFDMEALQAEAGKGNPLVITLNNGELRIDDDLNILGLGADILTIDGNSRNGVFRVEGMGSEVEISGLTITGGYANQGGGIYNDYATLTLNGMMICENESSGWGGGIYNQYGSLIIYNSTFVGNEASSSGGAIYTSGCLTMINSTLTKNSALNSSNGGAIYMAEQSWDSSIINCTISDNSSSRGSGIYISSQCNYPHTIKIYNTIISDNFSQYYEGGDLYVSNSQDVQIKNSFIVESNIDIESQGNNITSGNLNLAPLGYYGGSTMTMPLMAGSVAINAGDNSLAVDPMTNNAFATDQRGDGYDRIGEGTIDIGAVEGVEESNPITQTWVVDTLEDVIAADGKISLREAIEAANTNTVRNEAMAGSNYIQEIITFDFGTLQAEAGKGNPLVITLNNGELRIDDDLNILGLGADILTIDGNSRNGIFRVEGMGSEVGISGLTITGGYANQGGGIYNNFATLTLSGMMICENESSGWGGGIYNQGSLVIYGSTFAGNEASSSGGAIYTSGCLTMINSTLTKNSALNSSNGGAIYMAEQSWDSSIINCTISDNSSYYGGGVYISSYYNYPHTIKIYNTIISDNFSQNYEGGDLYVSNSQDVQIKNSFIVESNIDLESQGNNITSGNLNLAPLGYYGGLTMTMPLMVGSIAINAGDNSLAVNPTTNDALATDQRGDGYDRIGEGTIDIGAVEGVEESNPITKTWVVDTLEDVVAADGKISLREAIEAANTNTVRNEAMAGSNYIQEIITFDFGTLQAEAGEGNPLVITLDNGELRITNDLNILGLGADVLTIDGNSHNGIFRVEGMGSEVEISGLTVMGGSASEGSGIYNDYATLTLSRMMVCENKAYNRGGGIYNQYGNLIIYDSIFVGNESHFDGGAIYTSGCLTMINSTLTKNSALNSSNGGAIYMAEQSWDSSIINCTISDNSSYYGGGVYISSYYNYPHTIKVYNTIISDNFSQNYEGGDLYVSNSQGVLIKNSFIVKSNIDLESQGNNITSGNLNLAPLGYYGGQTMTMPLMAGSDAIDAGDNSLAVDPMTNNAFATDQRGDGYARIGDGTIDIGAVEGAEESNPITQTWVVDTLEDVIAADGKISLREAIMAANTNAVVNEAAAGSIYKQNTILFADSLSGGTIVLSEELGISDDLVIYGLGARYLTLDANGDGRVFGIGSSAEVLIEGLTITGGYFEWPTFSPNTSGGGIFNTGILTIRNVMISGNIATGGGGIFNYNGIVNVIASTIDHNESIYGGGILNYGNNAVLNVCNSTIAYNNYSDFFFEYFGQPSYGGGIYNPLGSIDIRNSTITMNQAANCGGLYSSSQSIDVAITNTIIAGNASSINPSYSNTFCYYGEGCYNNLIGNSYVFIGLPLDKNIILDTDDIIGLELMELNYYDSQVKVMPLFEGSRAINAGDDTYALDLYGNSMTVDAAGMPRFNGTVDIGAYEYYPVVASGIDLDLGDDTTSGKLLDMNEDGTPDTIMNVATGESIPVSNLTDSTDVVFVPSPQNPDEPEVQITVNKADGWIYTSFADPFAGARKLLSITTSDGRIISPNNWWIGANGNICVLDDPDVVYELDYENPAAVIGRHIFYNNSSFDTVSDDNAIATDKQALLTGSKATFANYTSYTRGINGIMVDISGLAGSVTLDDFTFRIGNSDTTSSWENASSPASINVRTGEGASNSDRVVITWEDAAIVNKWLEVTVLANANTGLASNDVFYFGNAISETGNSTLNASVNISDMALARVNQTGFTQAVITNLYDFNRDKKVNVTDIGLVRGHQSGFSPLRLIDLTTSEGIATTSDIIVLSRQTSNKAATPQQLSKSIWLDSDEDDDEDSLLAILQIA